MLIALVPGQSQPQMEQSMNSMYCSVTIHVITRISTNFVTH